MRYFYVILTSVSLVSLFTFLNESEIETQHYDMSEYEITITPSKN
jgi:hypothetical protein